MSPVRARVGATLLFVASLIGVTALTIGVQHTPAKSLIQDDRGGRPGGDRRPPPGDDGGPPPGDSGEGGDPSGPRDRGDRGGREGRGQWTLDGASNFAETLVPQIVVVGGFAGITEWNRRRRNKARRSALGLD